MNPSSLLVNGFCISPSIFRAFVCRVVALACSSTSCTRMFMAILLLLLGFAALPRPTFFLWSFRVIRGYLLLSSCGRFAFHGTGIFAEGRRAVALGAMIERPLACCEVLIFSLPRFECFVLQRAAVGKAEPPRLRPVELIDRAEMRCGDEVILAAG